MRALPFASLAAARPPAVQSALALLAGAALVSACGKDRPPAHPLALAAAPLPARAAAPDPRFGKLDPATTGLQHQNLLRRENVVAYVYSGAGLAVGDYDGDGLPDVYLVSQDGPNKLFRQTAPLRFVDVTASAGGLDGGDAWGTAASFADVDGDGDLDLHVCNLESPNLLYQNQGDGTFVEKAGPFGLGQALASMGCAFADYDQDGDLDCYLLTNRALRHNLPAEILAEVSLPTTVRRTKAELTKPLPAVFPRGKDGVPTVPPGYEEHFFLVDGAPAPFQAGQRDRLLRNDGYGRFVDASDEAGIRDQGNGLSVVWWDCDGDGRLDLYVANDFQSPDKLYRNLGGGRFQEVTDAMLPHTAFFGMGTDFGDVDGDGRFDLLVADMSSTSHYWGKMLMGSMDQHRWFLMHSRPQQYMRNALYVNTGTGRFQEAAHLAGLASTDWTWAVRFGDLDDDGRLDVYATNGIPVFTDNPDTGEEFDRLWRQGMQQQALALFRAIPSVPEKKVARRNVGDLRFEDVGAQWGLDEASVAHGAVLCDLDRDGDLDVIANTMNGPAGLWENRGSDGHRALVSLRGNGGNRFGVGARIEVTAGGRTQVRLVSPTRGYMSAGEPVEHFGLGDAARIERLVVRWPSGRVQRFEGLRADRWFTVAEAGVGVAAGEGSEVVPAVEVAKAGDASEPAAAGPVGATDRAGSSPAPASAADMTNPAAAASRATTNAPTPPNPKATDSEEEPPFFIATALPAKHTERDFDDYAIQPLLPHRLSRLGPGLACGDADGDGRVDVWLAGAAGQPGTLLHARPDGSFAPVAGPWAQHTESEDLGACWIDFDADGDRDLYVASGGVEAGARSELLRDRLYRNDGGLRFVDATADALPDVRRSSSCVAAADFDRDGDVDLFVGTRVDPGRFPHSAPSVLLRNDGGRFVDVAGALLPAAGELGMVTAAQWTDLDGDGWLDLAVAASWQPVRVLGNDGGKGFADRTDALGLGALRGQWQSLAAADLDGDGDVDLALGNLGLNTKYKASADKPLRLFARDFDGNGTFDVVEAKAGADGLLPVRGLSCSSSAMPFVRQRFPTYDAFACANLGAIYGDALAQCLELSCSELQHVVLRNDGARFAVLPLPRRAQLAPAFGIGVADFDGDGHQDLVLAQNFFSPEPETGRFDGGLGLWLRGRGDATFDVVPPLASGIVLPDDQKALALADLDGDGAPEWLSAANDGAVRAFRASMPSASLAVLLRGRAGNRDAIGARVTLVRSDGTQQVREVHAGSGYLAQGEPCAWFADVPDGCRLAVVWPDGARSEHAVTHRRGRLVVGR
ncbi:MAG: FG-GAP-like repeat-containing protein [Planctomycetota bacterium]